MPQRITISDLTGLKPKEANFVIEYCKDWSARRAATASGYAADSGYALAEKPHVAAAIERVLASRLDASHIDAEWVLMEAVDNHFIARLMGNITASNTALGICAKHKMVDAFAAEKIEVSSDKDVMDRLMRGRKRLSSQQIADDTTDGVEVSFL